MQGKGTSGRNPLWYARISSGKCQRPCRSLEIIGIPAAIAHSFPWPCKFLHQELKVRLRFFKSQINKEGALTGHWNAGMGGEVGNQFEWLDSWVWKLLTGRYLEYWIWLGAHLSADSYLSSFLSQGRWERGTQILHRPFVLLWSLEGEDAAGHQGYHEREEKAQGEGKGPLFYTSAGTIVEGDKKEASLMWSNHSEWLLAWMPGETLKKCVHSKHNQDESINHTRSVFVPPSTINNSIFRLSFRNWLFYSPFISLAICTWLCWTLKLG